jgi:hypothetical protein
MPLTRVRPNRPAHRAGRPQTGPRRHSHAPGHTPAAPRRTGDTDNPHDVVTLTRSEPQPRSHTQPSALTHPGAAAPAPAPVVEVGDLGFDPHVGNPLTARDPVPDQPRTQHEKGNLR